MSKKSVNLFGLNISDISFERSMELVRLSLLSGESRVFFTPNLEMLEEARKNKQIRNLINSASVLLPDGVGVLLASRIVGTPIFNKVPGIDFGEGALAVAENESAKVFLLGGKNGVAKKAAKKLLKRYPKLKICGIHNGYFNCETHCIYCTADWCYHDPCVDCPSERKETAGHGTHTCGQLGFRMVCYWLDMGVNRRHP
jgi:N-acetylglucosaminyldiphosphoundecaprenol N-acetyl-beta-D-mannosaminyltransferase